MDLGLVMQQVTDLGQSVPQPVADTVGGGRALAAIQFVARLAGRAWGGRANAEPPEWLRPAVGFVAAIAVTALGFAAAGHPMSWATAAAVFGGAIAVLAGSE